LDSCLLVQIRVIITITLTLQHNGMRGGGTLDWNSNRLSVPDRRRRRVIMCIGELPPCLLEQVTKLGDRAFCAVEVSHHHQVEMVYRARATEIGEERLRGWNEFCAGDFVRGRLVSGIRHQQVNADQLGVGAGTGAHVLQYFEAVFVGPVVEDSAQKEDRDVLLGLWVEEVLALELHTA